LGRSRLHFFAGFQEAAAFFVVGRRVALLSGPVLGLQKREDEEPDCRLGTKKHGRTLPKPVHAASDGGV